ncbi:MAG: hypothetical protein JWN44_4734 [Myxococcales bacterium]|nr:hypothetical protein [Myxococcales bacterium]
MARASHWVARVVVGCVALVTMSPDAAAQATLPYAKRTLSFNGLSTSVHGDIRTVGMGGASAGLADTFIAAMDNPAGLAMTVGIGDIHFASDSVQDANVQHFDSAITTNSFGLALGLYPWAVSVGYLSPYREEESYRLEPLRNVAQLTVITRELVVSAARLFAHDRFSVGVTLVLGQAQRQIGLSRENLGDPSYSSYTAGAVVGGMMQLPRRFLLGASFSTPLHYSGAGDAMQENLSLPGFFQSVEVPWRASLGLGFIPNRFFRADLTVHLLGASGNTALLRDERARVGENITLQPRFGAAYVFADYKEFKATVFVGTYYEFTRIAGTENRLHGTAGLEARIWILTIGGAIDAASGYRNSIVSVGADVFGIFARLKMMPTAYTPPYGRMFPRPYAFSDEGLARPLVKDWHAIGPDMDPIKVSIGIPKNLVNGVRNAGTELKQIARDVSEALEATNQTPEQKQKAAAAEAQEAERKSAADKLTAEKAAAVAKADEATRANDAATRKAADRRRAEERKKRLHPQPQTTHAP